MDDRRVLTVRRRLAAPAPVSTIEPTFSLPGEIDWQCIRWAHWCKTRKFYGAPDQRLLPILGRLRVKSTARDPGPGITAGADLARFHQAVTGLPERERLVLECFYVHRLRPIKIVAAAIGVSHKHFYKIRNDAAKAAYARSQQDG